jgi:hypothetical protein
MRYKLWRAALCLLPPVLLLADVPALSLPLSLPLLLLLLPLLLLLLLPPLPLPLLLLLLLLLLPYCLSTFLAAPRRFISTPRTPRTPPPPALSPFAPGAHLGLLGHPAAATRGRSLANLEAAARLELSDNRQPAFSTLTSHTTLALGATFLIWGGLRVQLFFKMRQMAFMLLAVLPVTSLLNGAALTPPMVRRNPLRLTRNLLLLA